MARGWSLKAPLMPTSRIQAAPETGARESFLLEVVDLALNSDHISRTQPKRQRDHNLPIPDRGSWQRLCRTLYRG